MMLVDLLWFLFWQVHAVGIGQQAKGDARQGLINVSRTRMSHGALRHIGLDDEIEPV